MLLAIRNYIFDMKTGYSFKRLGGTSDLTYDTIHDI